MPISPAAGKWHRVQLFVDEGRAWPEAEWIPGKTPTVAIATTTTSAALTGMFAGKFTRRFAGILPGILRGIFPGIFPGILPGTNPKSFGAAADEERS